MLQLSLSEGCLGMSEFRGGSVVGLIGSGLDELGGSKSSCTSNALLFRGIFGIRGVLP